MAKCDKNIATIKSFDSMQNENAPVFAHLSSATIPFSLKVILPWLYDQPAANHLH